MQALFKLRNINDFNVSVHFLIDAMGKHLHYITGTAFEMVSIGILPTPISVLILLGHMNVFNA